jgi:DNA polymerase III alpha subunit
MQTNSFGEMIFDQDDLCDAVMSGLSITSQMPLTVDHSIDLAGLREALPDWDFQWRHSTDTKLSLQEFDSRQQHNWFMPQSYRDLDIAQHVLSLCHGEAELQRAGQELLMFQERGLFDLLRYLTYLVDIMRANNIVWGVGRGSSVASFVLYKLDVHRINSLTYDLDPRQFLR